MTTQLHLAINAFALQLFLERAQRLIDIIVANDDLHKKSSNSLSIRARYRAAQQSGTRVGNQPIVAPKTIGRRDMKAHDVGGPLAAGPIQFKRLAFLSHESTKRGAETTGRESRAERLSAINPESGTSIASFGGWECP